MNAFALAVELVGGQTAMAKALGVRQSTIWSWLDRGTPLPPEICPAAEKAVLVAIAESGDQRNVRCEQLRPDVQWQRDKKGKVTGYFVRVEQAA